MGTFVSPIDGKTYSTEYTGAKTRTVANPLATHQTGSESFDPAAMFRGFTGVLTNKPGDALTYSNNPGADESYTNPMWYGSESQAPTIMNPNFKRQIEMADPEYERWMSNYWAYLHPEEYAATQAEQKGGGGLFDMAKGLATSNTMMPIWAALGAGLGGLGGTGAAAAGDTAALAAGDAMAGAIPAGELGAWTGAGAGTGGTLADLAGGNMDIFGPNLSDFTSPSGWDFGPGNIVDGGWNFGPGNINDIGIDAVSGMTPSGLTGSGATSWLNNAQDTLKKLLGGSGTTGAAAGSGGSGENNLMRLLGSLGAAGLGAYASNQQTNKLDEMAKRYEGYGAPYRQKLSDLYSNPDSFLKSNEVQKPVQMGTDVLMRSLSTKGNPFGSGNALQQGQSYASDQLFGKLGQEKDRLAGFGGLSSYNSAAPQTATNAIQSSSNGYNAIGAGLGNIFNPPKTEAQTMADFMKMMRG